MDPKAFLLQKFNSLARERDAFPRPVARLLVTVAAAVSLFVLGLLCLQFSSHWWGIGRMSWLLLADILKQNKVNHPNMRFDPRARTANSDRFIADYENDHISYCWSALLNFRAKEEEIKEGSFTISSSMNAENSKSSGSLPSYGVCCRINLRMCILSNGISKELNLLIDYCSYILKHFIIKL
uniref:Uncharacterized protein n=1 Tax=Chenopodium quinoa TaxID=63459 RepID=A0A803MQI6_CHEQI